MVLQYRIVFLGVLKALKCEFVLLFVAEYTYIINVNLELIPRLKKTLVLIFLDFSNLRLLKCKVDCIRVRWLSLLI